MKALEYKEAFKSDTIMSKTKKKIYGSYYFIVKNECMRDRYMCVVYIYNIKMKQM
jgi:hypothetical protein